MNVIFLRIRSGRHDFACRMVKPVGRLNLLRGITWYDEFHAVTYRLFKKWNTPWFIFVEGTQNPNRPYFTNLASQFLCIWHAYDTINRVYLQTMGVVSNVQFKPRGSEISIRHLSFTRDLLL